MVRHYCHHTPPGAKLLTNTEAELQMEHFSFLPFSVNLSDHLQKTTTIVKEKNLTSFPGIWTRVIESKSLKVGKSLKIGKNRIKSEKSDLIFY